VLGDIHAQVAGNEVGVQRLVAFMTEFKLENLIELGDEIIQRSEKAMRLAIATLPDRTLEHEVYADGYEEPVRLHVTIRKQGDEVFVDWAGSSPASSRGINVVLNYTHAYTTYALKCALAPDVPNNEGSFRPVHVAAPEGSILNAIKPAPVAARHILGHFLPGVIFGALSEVIPDRVLAEGAANIWNMQFTGYDREDQPFTYVWFSCGGTGARPTKDGIDATAFPSGIGGVPAEVIEQLSPVVMWERSIRPDSGGAGEFRGGCGQRLRLGVRTDRDYRFAPLFDRVKFAPQGYAGGHDGALATIRLSTGEQITQKGTLDLHAETEIMLDLPGGGGMGDPANRDPQLIERDLLNGYVTTERAAQDYPSAFLHEHAHSRPVGV
ncbi:MAG TPA: hydantoinase B/oxoprolinase family protein, partial [Thermomicrobiales bacterium]|nr:hydantoinase B/oxoprolinase family protein [Thermomicrobiales bacterium]